MLIIAISILAALVGIGLLVALAKLWKELINDHNNGMGADLSIMIPFSLFLLSLSGFCFFASYDIYNDSKISSYCEEHVKIQNSITDTYIILKNVTDNATACKLSYYVEGYTKKDTTVVIEESGESYKVIELNK